MQLALGPLFPLRAFWRRVFPVFFMWAGAGGVQADIGFVDAFQPLESQDELQAEAQALASFDAEGQESQDTQEIQPSALLTPSQEIKFSLTMQGAEAEAFGNQVIAQVQRNLGQFVRIDSPAFILDPIFDPLAMDQDVKSAPTQNQELSQGENQDPATGLHVQGEVSFQNGELIDMVLIVTSLSPADSRRETLSLRLDVRDWQRAGNYLSNTLYSRLFDRPGFFQSQVAFVAELPGHDGPKRRLARVDQAGGGLRFVDGAGDQVAYPTFLSNRFEIAFMDQADGRNRLMHYNILTTRLTYMMTLPDLVGAPALARGGRLVAFAAAEDAGGGMAADIYVSDVEMGKIRAIEIAGSKDSYPQFSPDLKVLCFISAQPAWSELLIAKVPYAMVDRDRTKRDGTADPMDGLGAQLRSLYGSPYPLHQPVWSPDGAALAFIEIRDGHSTLMHHDLNTGETQAVATATHMTDPVWSPDGREVLLVSAGALVRVNLAERRLTAFPTPYPAASPTWSRNGSGGSVVGAAR